MANTKIVVAAVAVAFIAMSLFGAVAADGEEAVSNEIVPYEDGYFQFCNFDQIVEYELNQIYITDPDIIEYLTGEIKVMLKELYFGIFGEELDIDSFAMVVNYTGTDTHVTIPGTVTDSGKTYVVYGIEDRMFFENSNIESVVMADSILYVGSHAFDKCYSLTSVTLSKNLLVIRDNAFSKCSIEKIVVPETVMAIDYGFVAECFSLKTIEFLGENIYFAENALNVFFSDDTKVSVISPNNWVGKYVAENPAVAGGEEGMKNLDFGDIPKEPVNNATAIVILIVAVVAVAAVGYVLYTGKK